MKNDKSLFSQTSLAFVTLGYCQETEDDFGNTRGVNFAV